MLRVTDMKHANTMNLFDYLTGNAESGNIALFESAKTTTTFGQLAALAEGVAGELTDGGVRPGDIVGILAENSAFWVASYLGILKTGAVAAPLPSRLTPAELNRYGEMLHYRALCADDRLLSKYGTDPGNGCPLVAKSRIMQLKTGQPAITPAATVNPSTDLAALMFTSGSTGMPNAVRVTHRNIMANTDSIISCLGISDRDRMMAILPFHYCFGTSLLHTHLKAGASLVLNNEFQFVEDMLNELEEFACTGFAGVPSTYQILLENRGFRKRSFPALRHVQQAGGKLAEHLIKELRNTLPDHVRIFISYGQTEATARLSMLPPECIGSKTGSIGKGIPGVTLSIVDSDGNPVPAGETGEIVASGANVTAGYLVDDPAKNPFRNGLLHTGDLAWADQDGFLYIVGRQKEFIKPSGYKVMTATIEQALLEIPGIIEAAVIGIPHERLGEAAMAFVVARPDARIDAAAILAACRKKLPLYAIPCDIAFLAALPKNAAGKVLKHELTGTATAAQPPRPDQSA